MSQINQGKTHMGPQLFIGANNQAYGPYEFAHVQAGVRRGEITAQHMLSYDGRQWFPAQAIWPQLLGQAGFGSPQPQAAQPIAQARQVLQAQAVATPASSVPPGVALPAQSIDAEPNIYSLWPGRFLLLGLLVILAGATSMSAIVVLHWFPLDVEFKDGSLIKRLDHIGLMVQGFGIWLFSMSLVVWSAVAAHRLTRRNVDPLPPSPGWTIAIFLIPGVNVFYPPILLQRLWKSSDWAARGLRRPQSTSLIPLWWFTAPPTAFLVWMLSILGKIMGPLPIPIDDPARAIPVLQDKVWLVDNLSPFLPGLTIIETLAWILGLVLFVMFDARVRTRVEMG